MQVFTQTVNKYCRLSTTPWAVPWLVRDTGHVRAKETEDDDDDVVVASHNGCLEEKRQTVRPVMAQFDERGL